MKKLFASLGTFLTSYYLAGSAFAADEPWKVNVTPPKEAIKDFGLVISGGIRIAIMIAILLCLLYLIWGGIEWLTSGGAKEGVASAKARMTNAFIGLMVVLAAYAIALIIGHLFNLDVTKFELPSLVPSTAPTPPG